MKNLIGTMVAAVMLASCGSHETETTVTEINIGDIMAAEDTPDFTWNDIVDEVRVVPLQFNEMLPTLSVKDITSDGRHLLLGGDIMQSAVYIADLQTGEVVRKIDRKGRAANEYLQLGNANIYDDKIYISDLSFRNIKTLIYDLDGNYISTIENDSLRGYSIEVIDDNTFVMHDGLLGLNVDESFYRILLVDSLCRVKSRWLPATLDKSLVGAISISSDIRYGDGYVCNTPDTVYMIDANGLSPLYRINMDNVNDTDATENKTVVDANLFHGDIVGGVASKENDYVFFLLKDGKLVARRRLVLDESNYYNLGFDCVLPDGRKKSVWNVSSAGDYIINITDAYRMEGIIDSIGEEDNPVMIVMKMKR